jgi:hypothetical protein
MADANAWYTPSAPFPVPHVPIPTAILGREGNSFARPASFTVLKEPKS